MTISVDARPRSRPLPARVGLYLLVDALAQGGFATVYLGRVADSPVGRWFAIKLLHDHLANDRDVTAMFYDEARLAMRVSHPNVCQVVDFGDDEGMQFLVMDYVLGESLGTIRKRLAASPDVLSERDRLALVLRVTIDAARGLHAAHEATDDEGRALQIVHRDVAPSNIFLRYDGHAQVLDFGIATATGRTVKTATGTVKGHLAYLSPEQVLGEPIDRRVDVYALAICAWETLTGRSLFGRATEALTLMAVANTDAPDVREVAPWVPASVADVLGRALRRSPDDRFGTCADFATALEALERDLALPTAPGEVSLSLDRLFPDGLRERRERLVRAARIAGDARSSGRHEPVAAPPAPAAPASEAPTAAAKPSARSGSQRRPGRTAALVIGASTAAALALFAILGSTVAPTAEAPTPIAVASPPAPVVEPPVPAPRVVEIAPVPTATTSEPPASGSIDNGAADEPTVAASPRRRAAREGRRSAPAETSAPSGFVYVTTRGTWGTVHLGARRLGETPGRFEIPSGSHQLRVVSGDGAATRQVRVQVDPGATVRVQVDFASR